MALTFITLCRIAGIPARWESGFAVAPGDAGCHDWARFYVAPKGWMYADCSCVQGDSSFTNRGYGPRAGAQSSICAPPPAGNGGFPFIGKCGMV